MINFRFHLVSLTAVFMALAAGVTIGAGVVDRATVDFLERSLNQVEANRRRTNAENDVLRNDLARWTTFEEAARGRLIGARLENARVFVLAMRGLDADLVGSLASTVREAGASSQGTLWFTSKWSLQSPDDVQALATLVDLPPTTREADVRAAALERLGENLASGDLGDFGGELLGAGFLEYDPPPSAPVPLDEVPTAETLFLVVGGFGASTAAGDVAHPLVEQLVARQARVLATEPQVPLPPTGADRPIEAEPFVASLRDRPEVTPLSTVDNADDPRGRAAIVFALEDLLSGRTGHYGFAEGAQILPPSGP